MRWILAMATLAAAAALTFGVLATRATTGQASLFASNDDRGGVSGALSYRATVAIPPRAHWQAVGTAFALAHRGVPAAAPKSLREATHLGVLWALARFALPSGAVVSERFSWTRRDGWRDLGATRARCPSVPPEVRSAWHLTFC
jgi:uncharacterized lipoprotein YbaY